jgi:ketosteroid isomerase-like protein
MLSLWLLLAAGAGFLVTSAVIANMARAQPTVDPATVVAGFESARNNHDLDTAMSYFADNAVITQRNASFTGKDEIRRYLDSVSARSRYVVVSDRHTSGNLVTWTERATLQGPDPGGRPVTAAAGGQNAGAPGFYGRGGAGQAQSAASLAAQTAFAVNVEAVVLDGKIQSLAYVFGNQVVRTDAALDGRAQLPATVGLAAVLALSLGALLIASIGFGRRSSGSSSLRGRLMQDLQGWAAARQ